MTVALNAAEFSIKKDGSKEDIINSVASLEDSIPTGGILKAADEVDEDVDQVGAPFVAQKSQVVEPYFSGQQEDTKPTSAVKEKIDYVIHLLESQRDMRTGSATEDLILYGFLGIFIIFVLDSFTRSAKYKR